MVDANVPDDVRRFENRVFGPFTQRQMVSTGIGLLILIPLALILGAVGLGIAPSIIIAAIPALPVMMCGYIKINNTNAETLIARIIYAKLLTPQKRKTIKTTELRNQVKAYKKALYENSLSDRRARDKRAYKKGKIVYNKKDFTYYR